LQIGVENLLVKERNVGKTRKKK